MTKPNYQNTQTNVKEEEKKKGTKSLNRKRLPMTAVFPITTLCQQHKNLTLLHLENPYSILYK
jgi:hypothetical protein